MKQRTLNIGSADRPVRSFRTSNVPDFQLFGVRFWSLVAECFGLPKSVSDKIGLCRIIPDTCIPGCCGKSHQRRRCCNEPQMTRISRKRHICFLSATSVQSVQSVAPKMRVEASEGRVVLCRVMSGPDDVVGLKTDVDRSRDNSKIRNPQSEIRNHAPSCAFAPFA